MQSESAGELIISSGNGKQAGTRGGRGQREGASKTMLEVMTLELGFFQQDYDMVGGWVGGGGGGMGGEGQRTVVVVTIKHNYMLWLHHHEPVHQW